MSTSDIKQIKRVLKFLDETNNVSISPFAGPGESKALLFTDAGKKMLVSANLLDNMQKAALLKIVEGKVALTEIGKKRKARDGGGDQGFQTQHRQISAKTIKVDGKSVQVLCNGHESPLARLSTKRRKDGRFWIEGEHLEAGERFRRDFTTGQLMQKVSSSWDLSGSRGKVSHAGKADIADSALDARDRIKSALEAVGPELGDVLMDVCCFLKGLEIVERERQWPPRSAKLMVRTGLELLARHYGSRAGFA